MQNRIVAIDEDAWTNISNLRHLPPSFTLEGYRVAVHNQPRLQIQGVEECTNFDLVITMEPWEELQTEQQVILPRLPKSAQLANLNRRIRQGRFLRFIPTPVYKSLDVRDTESWAHTGEFPRWVVVKPEHGAKGKSQFLIDTRYMTPDGLLNTLRDCDTYGDLCQAFPHLKRGEHHNDDGEKLIHNQRYILQMYVEDVASEQRVLWYVDHNHDVQAFVFDRERGSNDDKIFGQATGARVYYEEGMPAGKPLAEYYAHSSQLCDELLDLIRHTGLEMGSMDVYRTHNGHYGIFEYCNQFGTRGDASWYTQFHMQAVLSWLKLSDRLGS